MVTSSTLTLQQHNIRFSMIIHQPKIRKKNDYKIPIKLYSYQVGLYTRFDIKTMIKYFLNHFYFS